MTAVWICFKMTAHTSTARLSQARCHRYGAKELRPKLRPGPNRPDPTPEPGRAEKGGGEPRNLPSLGTDRGPRLAQYWPIYRFASLYFLLVPGGPYPDVVTPARPKAAGGRRLPHLTVQRQLTPILPGGAAASLHPFKNKPKKCLSRNRPFPASSAQQMQNKPKKCLSRNRPFPASSAQQYS